jgi:hypothetical protein
MTSQFIRATESFCAARELAGVRLLAGMSADVTSLMLKTMKSSIAKRTFIGTWEILSSLLGSRTSTFHERWK